MPMGRIFIGRKSRRSKPKTGALAIAKSNKRKITSIRKSIENKYRTINRPNAAFAALDTFLLLNDLAVGNDALTRIGNDIRGQFFSMNISFRNNGDFTSRAARILIFTDKIPNGAQPLITSILANTGSQGEKINSLLNPNYTKRFKIHKDIIFISSDSGLNDVNTSKFFKIRVPLNNVNVEYNAPGAGIASHINNTLYFLMIINPTGGTFTDNFLGFNTRYTYKDS